MSNTRNMNQANNFWDFVASLQNNPAAFPFAEGRGQESDFNPFEGGHFWGPFGPMPHRGRRHGPHDRRGSPPPGPPGPHDGPSQPPSGHERDGHAPPRGPPAGPHGHQHGPPHGPHHHHGPPHHHGREPRGPPPPPGHGVAPPPPPPFNEPISRSPTPPTPPETPAEPHHHPRSRSPHHRGPGPHHHRGPSPHHRRGGRHCGRGGRFGPHRGGPRNNAPFPFDLNALAEAFAPGLLGSNPFSSGAAADISAFENRGAEKEDADGTFTPPLDLFNTASAYLVHLSLPGAKKSDLDITYNASRNAITISGVVTRPGIDEDMMNTLTVSERRVGVFEREVRLEEGVKVDEEGIGAKLEDGVLKVRVPKVLPEEEEGWESVKRVEVE